MELGYTKNEILSMLDQHLSNLASDLESQVAKIKHESGDAEVSIATLISSSMMSILEAVSAVIEVNNRKVHDDLIKNGVLKEIN